MHAGHNHFIPLPETWHGYKKRPLPRHGARQCPVSRYIPSAAIKLNKRLCLLSSLLQNKLTSPTFSVINVNL